MMKNLLTISILLLPFSTNISFANETTDNTPPNQEQTSSSENGEALKATPDESATSKIGLTVQESEFLAEAEKLSKSSKTPASDLITFMKNKHLRSALAKKLKDYLESFQYKVSEKPGGGVSISYTKDDYIQADDGVNNAYKVARKADNSNIDKHGDTPMYHCTNTSNDDIAIRIQNLDKTVRLVSSDIGLLNDSIISTQIKLDGIVHNLNNIIGYIQMTDGYKWQSFLQNMQVEKNNQPTKEYIISMDNLSKTINDMSIVLKQVMEQKAAVQPQVIQQPCQQVHQSQYVDNLNKMMSDLSVMLQQALKRDDSQSNQKCQSCLINERINKVNDSRASHYYTESIEPLIKTLLNISEKLNDIVKYKYNYDKGSAVADIENKCLEQDRVSSLVDLNASLVNISNELHRIANKMDAIDDEDVNITVIGQGSLNPSKVLNDVNKTISDEYHDAKDVKVLIDENSKIKLESVENSSKFNEAQKEDNKSEIHSVDEPKNLGIVKKQISEFQSIIDGNKDPEIGHNGIINSDSATSRYNEIKTELEHDSNSKVENIPLTPPQPALPVLINSEKEEVVKEITDATVLQPSMDDKKVEAVIDKEAEKDAAYDRFFEKRRLEREQELSEINDIDDNDKQSSVTPPPAPALDLSKVPGTSTSLKVNKKSSVGSDSSAPKKLGIVAEMAKRFEALSNGGSKPEHNGIIKKDSHTSGYDKVKKHLKKKHK